jgi:hypothetical protein
VAGTGSVATEVAFGANTSVGAGLAAGAEQAAARRARISPMIVACQLEVWFRMALSPNPVICATCYDADVTGGASACYNPVIRDYDMVKFN